jgi:amino acid transporter
MKNLGIGSLMFVHEMHGDYLLIAVGSETPSWAALSLFRPISESNHDTNSIAAPDGLVACMIGHFGTIARQPLASWGAPRCIWRNMMCYVSQDTGDSTRMNFDFKATAQLMLQRAIHHFWATPQQRWTTGSVIAGVVLASIFMPAFGIAVFGTAFAGSGIAVVVVTVFFGLVGNRIGIGREKAEMMRQSRPPKDL